jgi:hypothetical protein
MGKPYSDLEKQALAVIRGGGNPANSADKGLANYWTWRLDPLDASHDLPEASTRSTGRKLDYIAVKPFATLAVATQYAKVTISQRSLQGMPTALKATAGFKTIIEEPGALLLGKFTPAKVYFRRSTGSTNTERTSRITKRKYKTAYSASDQGYGVPFGKVAATDTLLSSQEDIAALLGGGTTPWTQITFSPEKFRG